MREMKDSGLQWAGNIPYDWNTTKGKYFMAILERPIKDDDGVITCFRNGEVTLRANRREDGFTIATVEAGYQGIEPGDLVIHGMDGFAGAIGISDSRGKGTPALNVLACSENKKYIMYLLRAMAYTEVFMALSTGIRVRTCDTNWKKLRSLDYLIPPEEEQHRIADFLDAKCAEIDALVADIQTQIDTLEQYKRSVITETVTKGLNPDAKMKDSGIEWVGEIPAHWLVHPVYYYYGERKNKNYLGKEDNLLSLSYGRVVRKDINTSDGLLPESFNTYNIVETGDIIIRPTDLQNDKRSLRTGLVKEHGIITSAYIDLCPIKQVDSRYFYFLLHAYDVMKVFYNMGNGVRQGLNYSEFSRLMVFEPPYEEQVAIADYLETKVIEVDAIIERKKEQMSVLDAYKRSLIFEYVTGKKEVRNETADAIVALNPHIILLGIINDRIGKKHTRGKVQLQKLLYLLDIHVGMNVNTKYYRYEHGPYDRQLNCYIDVLIKNRWYEQRHDNGEILIKGKNHDEFVRKYKNQFREKQMEINQLIDALRDMKTSQLERIATLYAVWNDFILEGENHPTDEKILHEVVTNWTANKANPQDGTWKLSLEKMKKLGIIPTGKGLHTSRKPMRKAENE